MKQTTLRNGMGFAARLTLLFIGLKLTGYVRWHWWQVLILIGAVVGGVVGTALLEDR